MVMEDTLFEGLNVSSKFAICGLPIRWDSYKTCSFGCRYCFAENRKVMEYDKHLQFANLKSLENRCKRVYDDKNIDKTNFLDVLMANRVTWHAGGMSDPFQPCESNYHITSDAIEVMKDYGISCLFSTKSDSLHGAVPNPDLHTFQLSVTNVMSDRDWEPNVPDIQSRKRFFDHLKNEGFRVGIRIQPFIPGLTTTDIIDMFDEADNFSIEGLKIVPQNEECKEFIFAHTNLRPRDFTQMGLLNIRPQIRNQLYRPFIDRLEEKGLRYSMADNDMHHLGNNLCCCGDRLITASSMIDNTYLSHTHGMGYTKEQVDEALSRTGCKDCRCNNLFTSNRQEGCTTVQEFFDKRFYRDSSPWSPDYRFTGNRQKSLLDF